MGRDVRFYNIAVSSLVLKIIYLVCMIKQEIKSWYLSQQNEQTFLEIPEKYGL